MSQSASSYLKRRWSPSLLGCFLIGMLGISSGARAQSTCPDLRAYYPARDADWLRMIPQLSLLQESCLESAEYYALLGAAQLNSGYVAAAMEALERALLLQPDHGAAAVDYARALYLAGQLFPALQLNEQLLQRNDLPQGLGPALSERQQIWQAQTRSHTFTADVALGYDDNLNGAPARSDFTLTLSGVDQQLTLDEKFRPIKGPYANFRLGGQYRRLSAADRTHDFAYSIRNRQSEFAEAELLQSDLRYGLGIPLRRYRWDLTAGSTHLLYGGSPLFTANDFRARIRRRRSGCQPLVEAAVQHQIYHQQSLTSGMEYGLTGGLECQIDERRAVFGLEGGPVYNQPLDSARLGGQREGWVVRLLWQQALGGGQLRSQYSIASLKDAGSYSDLLQNGARREIYSRQWRMQYLLPLHDNWGLQLNLSHQRQGSNLDPFASSGTAADIGLSLAF